MTTWSFQGPVCSRPNNLFFFLLSQPTAINASRGSTTWNPHTFYVNQSPTFTKGKEHVTTQTLVSSIKKKVLVSSHSTPYGHHWLRPTAAGHLPRDMFPSLPTPNDSFSRHLGLQVSAARCPPCFILQPFQLFTVYLPGSLKHEVSTSFKGT